MSDRIDTSDDTIVYTNCPRCGVTVHMTFARTWTAVNQAQRELRRHLDERCPKRGVSG